MCTVKPDGQIAHTQAEAQKHAQTTQGLLVFTNSLAI